MDKELIRKALDSFEDDKYTDAKEMIQKEIQKKRDAFIKNKLELSQDINPTPTETDDKGVEGEE